MSVKKTKPAIIFDLGGVLIDWNPRHLYRKLFAGDEAAMESFLADVCSQDWNVKQDAGRLLSEAICELTERHPGHEPLIRAWVDRWPETLAGAIEPAVEVLAELKGRGYSLFALSNWSAETFPYARERFEFLAWFEEILISGEVKLVKPDAQIFALLLKRIGRRADQCVFIDDSETNVWAARRLGFQAVHFRSAELLHSELCRMGILS